jgi:hypothetical protein
VPRGDADIEGCAKLCEVIVAEKSAIAAHERLIDLDISNITPFNSEERGGWLEAATLNLRPRTGCFVPGDEMAKWCSG